MKLPSKAKYLEIEYMFFYFPSFNDYLLLRQLRYGPIWPPTQDPPIWAFPGLGFPCFPSYLVSDHFLVAKVEQDIAWLLLWIIYK